jgi:hypothetical protein
MLRCCLIRRTDDEYLFVHTAPHLAFEGASVAILYRDLSSLYSAFIENRPLQLPALEVQYADFAFWQRNLLTGQRLEDLTEYWRRQLTGAPSIELPCDFPRPEVHTMRGRREIFSMNPDLLRLALG